MRLAAAGLVAKRPDPDDARARRVVLTSEGRRVLKATAPEHVERVRSWIIDRLDRRDVVELGRIAATLLAHLHDVAPAEAG